MAVVLSGIGGVGLQGPGNTGSGLGSETESRREVKYEASKEV